MKIQTRAAAVCVLALLAAPAVVSAQTRSVSQALSTMNKIARLQNRLAAQISGLSTNELSSLTNRTTGRFTDSNGDGVPDLVAAGLTGGSCAALEGAGDASGGAAGADNLAGTDTGTGTDDLTGTGSLSATSSGSTAATNIASLISDLGGTIATGSGEAPIIVVGGAVTDSTSETITIGGQTLTVTPQTQFRDQDGLETLPFTAGCAVVSAFSNNTVSGAPAASFQSMLVQAAPCRQVSSGTTPASGIGSANSGTSSVAGQTESDTRASSAVGVSAAGGSGAAAGINVPLF